MAPVFADEEAEAFYILSTTPVGFGSRDRHCDYRSQAYMIRLDKEGELQEIRLATFLRGLVDRPAEQVEPFYRTYRRLYRYIRDVG